MHFEHSLTVLILLSCAYLYIAYSLTFLWLVNSYVFCLNYFVSIECSHLSIFWTYIYIYIYIYIGVGCTWHTWAQAQVKFLKVVDFFSIDLTAYQVFLILYLRKVNKISNMTLWFLHTLKEPWLINITLKIIFNIIIKNCIRVYQN